MAEPLSILHSESSMGWGGQEIRILAELTGLARRGCRMGLLVRPGSKILERARAVGVQAWEVQFRHALDLPSAVRAARLLRAAKADVLVTHSSKDSWVGAGQGDVHRMQQELHRSASRLAFGAAGKTGGDRFHAIGIFAALL